MRTLSSVSRAAGASGLALALAAAAAGSGGCSTSRAATESAKPEKQVVDVPTVTVSREPILRTFRVTGTLMADEQAEASAETNGRIVSTPVERGTVVKPGQVLVQLSGEQTAAQLAEADANAARIAAGLGLGDNEPLDVERVPDVANARAELALAETEYARIKSLLDQKVVSPSEYDQRQTRVEAARQHLEAERNKARQEFRSLEAARARVALARKAVADTTVRAPFAGVVAERRVSAGDYVTTGTVVATVVRVNPLRVELSVPEQDVSRVKAGQTISFAVDAYPGRQFEGTVRYVSPSLRPDQRALTVEATVKNESGELKPGLFATADVSEPERHDALLVSRDVVREVGNTRRVFVVKDGVLHDRIVTIGQVMDDRIVITSGLEAGEVVAIAGNRALADGLAVRATTRGAAAGTAPAAQ